MQIDDLDCFLQVANSLSITKAAELLHISQQALSAKIKNMEQYYKVPLIETLPNRRGIALTYAGELLRQSAAQIVTLNRRVQNLGYEKHLGSSVYGDLYLGATNNRFRHFLQGPMVQFHSIYPNVTIHARSGMIYQVERMLLDGVIDVAFGLDSFQSEHISTLHLTDERLMVSIPAEFLPHYWGISPDDTQSIARLRRGVPVQQLHGMPLLLFGRENYLRKLIEELFQKNGMTALPVVELGDVDALLRLANAGLGITFCRELVVAFNDLFRQESCKLLSFPVLDAPRTQYVLGTRCNYIAPAFVEHFITIVQEHIRTHQSSRPL